MSGFLLLKMQEKELKVLVRLGAKKFLSVNELYKCRVIYKYGRPVASMYKNPDAKVVEHELREQLRALDLSEYKDWLRDTPGFDVYIQFILKRNITKLDSSNLVKNFEDIWTRFVKEDLGIENYDDSKHIKLTVVKSLIPKASSEYACLSLTKSKVNTRYDLTPGPEKILVHLQPDTDRKEFEKILKKVAPRKWTLDYLPVEEETWDPEIEKTFSAQYWDHDTSVFILTSDTGQETYRRIYQALTLTGLDENRHLRIGYLPGANRGEVNRLQHLILGSSHGRAKILEITKPAEVFKDDCNS